MRTCSQLFLLFLLLYFFLFIFILSALGKSSRCSYSQGHIHGQEVQANIDLLEEIIRREISDLQAEKERLTNQELPKRKAKLEKKAVSDFSISKLALPQISEGSNDAMEVDQTKGAPPATDQ